MDSHTKLIKNKDLQEVLIAINDLKKPKGVPAKEIINFIANRPDTLPDKEAVAAKIKLAIKKGLELGLINVKNGKFSTNKLREIPGGLNLDVPLTKLRRRRGRRGRGRGRRGGRRRGRRRGRRHSDDTQTLQVNVDNVVQRLIKEFVEEAKKEICDDLPAEDSESPSRDSLRGITELRRRRRGRSRGRRQRKHRTNIHELKRRRRRRRGRRGRRHHRRAVDTSGEN